MHRECQPAPSTLKARAWCIGVLVALVIVAGCNENRDGGATSPVTVSTSGAATTATEPAGEAGSGPIDIELDVEPFDTTGILLRTTFENISDTEALLPGHAMLEVHDATGWIDAALVPGGRRDEPGHGCFVADNCDLTPIDSPFAPGETARWYTILPVLPPGTYRLVLGDGASVSAPLTI